MRATSQALANVRRELRERDAIIEGRDAMIEEEKRKAAAASETWQKEKKALEERLQEDLDASNRECRRLKSKVSNLQDELDNYEVTVGNQKMEITKLSTTVGGVHREANGMYARIYVRIDGCLVRPLQKGQRMIDRMCFSLFCVIFKII